MLLVQNLAKSYRQGDFLRAVLSGVDFELAKGEAVALIGRSGSGKSTLLNLIAGLDVPDLGSIHIDGQRVDNLSEDQRSILRRQKMGFVFQQFHLIDSLTVRENVALSLDLLGRQDHARVDELLERVGLQGHQADYPDRLSGGEQQRVAIARALAHRPTLLLADEPTGNLDEESAEIVLELLLGLCRDQGSTCLMVTHSLEVAARCQRTLELHKHTVRLVAPPVSGPST